MPALIWLVAGDFVIDLLALDPSTNNALSVGSSILFVLVSASLLYLLLRREFGRLNRSRQLLADSNAQLTDRETRLRLLFEQAPVGIALVRHVAFDFINPALARMFGYADLAAMRAKPLQDHFAVAARDMLVERIRRREAGLVEPIRYDITGLHQDGSTFEIEVNSQLVELADGPVVFAFLSDITERAVASQQIRLAYDDTILGWSRALDLRDKETEGHSQRVTALTERLARSTGMSEEELVHVRRGSLLHDIGKMGVPDRILLKPEPLTDDEWAIMRQHPTFAYELLAPISYLRPALDIPYCHHEKWDGTGYPRGLQGELIPLSARIFAVVDVWDALRSDRPYRPAWETERVRAHIQELSGAHFDPAVVTAFLGLDLTDTH